MKNEKNYNIGLDIGVGSVGWCLTDENNNIIKKRGRNLWGARIFTEAQSAATRRSYRSERRRKERRKERINILQSLVQEDMEKEFPNFFPMLKEAALIPDDKNVSESINGIKNNLFSDEQMKDKNYFDEFPTIYHLRHYLVKEKNKVDFRLVYLAIHHIIKYRGNFLYEGNFADNTLEITEKLNIIINFLEQEYQINLIEKPIKIREILSEKNQSRSQKKERIIKCFNYVKEDKSIIDNCVKAMVGNSFELDKLFDINIDRSKICFANEIENEEEILDALQENVETYEALKTIYSWCALQDILKGKQYISEGFIEKYNNYAKDLKLLKEVYKTYFPCEYKDMFRTYGTTNYVAYNGKNTGKRCKKCKPEDFFDSLKKKIEKLPDDCKEKKTIKNALADDMFLNKINVTDNGTIPHQLHGKELEMILENQSKYYKTLRENKEKILKTFSFRIPYYVGPLSKYNKNWSWVRRKNEKIRPWNFEKIVDIDSTAEEFINRMTNRCTYILNENVMPKQSILYSEFCVLNELNNIRINNKHIEKDTKKLIIDRLFKEKKKVTKKMILSLCKLENIEVKTLTGLSDNVNFNSNMSAYIDMKRIFGKVDESNMEQCENLIYWITVFADKRILKRKIQNEYKNITDVQIKELIKLKYTGWSRLSKELISRLKSNDGENIMDKLRKTPLNFMQIINNDDFGFNKEIEKLMPKAENGINYGDIKNIPTSPANKRAIWQTVCVVKEIIKVMQKEPKNIYIEFARSEDKEKIMKDNRAKNLLKKYDEIRKQLKDLKEFDNNVYKELKQHQSDKSLSEKMYLYFIQNGKCMYSGKTLNIDNLNLYEVDHIIPQSYIKDDSIDNKSLVIREENQRKKDSLLLNDNIINRQIPMWNDLLKKGLISQSKFFKLTRRKMFETNNEREKFVQRQLVETRQITKYVTNLFVNEYKNTNIFSIRSELTHGFRNKYELYKNRNVNNYHHAQDAYILCTIGNILDAEWKGINNFKYGEYVKRYLQEEKNKKQKYGMIMGFIQKQVDVDKVKKILNYKDCYISRMLEEQTGEFYHQTVYGVYENKKNLVPQKNGKDPDRYGGYSNENKAYSVIFGYVNKKGKQEYMLVGVPIRIAYMIKKGQETTGGYIRNTYLKNVEYSNLQIIRNKVLKNQEYLDENNEQMRLCSDSEIRPAKELIISDEINKLIYLMNSDESKLDDTQKEKVLNGYTYMYTYLIDKLNKEYKMFSSIYPQLIERIEKFKDLDIQDKKAVINGLINLMETGQGNLKCMGLSDREGRKSGQKFKTERLLNMTFIDKSITGIYERRFRINGVENCSSK